MKILQAIAYAAARAMSSTTVSVKGAPGCQGSATGSASAQAVATALAQAYANALSQSCGSDTSSSVSAVSQAFAQAASQAQASVTANGGDAEATATALAEVCAHVETRCMCCLVLSLTNSLLPPNFLPYSTHYHFSGYQACCCESDC